MSLSIGAPLAYYLDKDGRLLNGGHIYIGRTDADPEAEPVAVFWDEALTIPAAQPLRTWNGMVSRAGTPAQVYTSQDHSIRVRDKNLRQVFYAASSASFNLSARLSSGAARPDAGAGAVAFNQDAPYEVGSLGQAVQVLQQTGGGIEGQPGPGFFTATIYRQAVEQPDAPTGGSFNFGTATLTAPSGWLSSEPAVSATPTWACDNTFRAQTSNAVVTAGTWRAVRKEAEAGKDGISRDTLDVYLQSSTAPAAPVGGSYNVSTDVLTVPPGGWLRDQPNSSAVPTWRARIRIGTATPTTDLQLGAWGLPVAVARDGAAGISVYTATVYRQETGPAQVPARPQGGEYNFVTGVLTPPAGWVVAQPGSAPGAVTFAGQYTFKTNDTSIPTPAGAWTLPQAVSAPSGAAGISSHVATVYLQQAAQPSSPTGGSYNFTTGVLTAPAAWFVSQPNTSSVPTWAVEQTFATTTPATPVAGGQWGLVYADSQAGGSGTSSDLVHVYRQDASTPTIPAGGSFNFSTGVLTPPAGWLASQPDSATTPTWRVSFFFATSTPTTPVAAGTWINRIVAAQNGAPGGQGIPGQRGSVETSAAIAGNAWSSAAAAVAINSAGYPFAVILDRVTLYNSAAGYAETRFWSGTQWETYTTRINGNLLLDGTLGAQAIVTRSITTDKLVLGAATSLNSFGTTSPIVLLQAPSGTPTSGGVYQTSTPATTSGGPVQFDGIVHIRGGQSYAGGSPLPPSVSSVAIVVSPTLDGAVLGVGAGPVSFAAESTAIVPIGAYRLNCSIPFKSTFTPTPGLHSFGVVIATAFYNSLGALVFVSTGVYFEALYAYNIFENKV